MRVDSWVRAATAGAFVMLFVVEASALGAKNVLEPYFDRVKDKGFPVAGRAYRDGTAFADVYAKGEVTRYSFDKEGKIKSAVSPQQYSITAIKTARFSAAAAAAATVVKADEKAAEIRAVIFVNGRIHGAYVVCTFDKDGDYFGKHRYKSTDGAWEGFVEAIGEQDPLGPKQ